MDFDTEVKLYNYTKLSNMRIIQIYDELIAFRMASSSVVFAGKNNKTYLTRLTNKMLKHMWEADKAETRKMIMAHKNKKKMIRLAPFCMSIILGDNSAA